MVTQLVGGLRSGMGYTGCRTIKEFQEKTRFLRITSGRLARVARARRGHHQGSAELSVGVTGKEVDRINKIYRIVKNRFAKKGTDRFEGDP